MLIIKSPRKKSQFIRDLTVPDWRALNNWAIDNIFADKIFPAEDWIELSFYLMKERWGADMDWLEKQPMSKILTMIEVQKRHGQRVRASYKKK